METQSIQLKEQEPTSKGIFGKIRSLFKREKGNDSEVSNHLFSEREKVYHKNFQELGEWRFSSDAIVEKKDLLNEITQEGKSLRSMGEEDGEHGLNPSAMQQVARNVASLWQTFIESSFQHKKLEWEQRKADLQLRHDQLKEDRKRLLKQKEYIDEHYQLNPKSYNRILGIVYLLIALSLIIADYPLTLQVANNVFQLNSSSSFLPEAQLFGFGLALVTVFVKIMYDEYLGNSIQKWLLKKKPKFLISHGEIANEKDESEAKRIRIVRLLVKLGILIGLMYAIYALASVRLDFLSSGISQENSNDNSINALDALKTSPIAKYAFISISLLFPIISGICASIGFDNISNVRHRKKIDREIKRKGKKCNDSLNELTKATAIHEKYAGYVEWAKVNGSFVNECSQYFFSCYLHGYDRGMRRHLSDDLYESAINIRNKFVALKATDKFIQMITKRSDYQSLYENYYPQHKN